MTNSPTRMLESEPEIARELLETPGYWTVVHGAPAGDGRQKRCLYGGLGGDLLTIRFGTIADFERMAKEHAATGTIKA